jgi:hypothetical protein
MGGAIVLPIYSKQKKTKNIMKKSSPVSKKSGPVSKKSVQADSMLTGKTFGKVLKPGQKSDTYYYAEGVRGGGQGGIKNKPKKTYNPAQKMAPAISRKTTTAKKR